MLFKKPLFSVGKFNRHLYSKQIGLFQHAHLISKYEGNSKEGEESCLWCFVDCVQIPILTQAPYASKSFHPTSFHSLCVHFIFNIGLSFFFHFHIHRLHTIWNIIFTVRRLNNHLPVVTQKAYRIAVTEYFNIFIAYSLTGITQR